MSMHSNRHPDNFTGDVDSAVWPWGLVLAGILALAALAWALS